MAPSVYGPGQNFDELLDKLRDMGCPAPQWGRQAGHHTVWLRAHLPGPLFGKFVERETLGPDLDFAALAMIVIELTADDHERAAALEALGAEA